MIDENLRKKKLAHLFAVAKQVGYDDRSLREIVEIQTGSESLRALNANQLKSVIASIQKAHPSAFKSTPRRFSRTSQPRQPGVIAMPSLAQKRKLSDLEIDIQVYNSTFKADKISLKMFKKLPSSLNLHQLQSLIEALKSILKRSSLSP
jgi:hypothetical protein